MITFFRQLSVGKLEINIKQARRLIKGFKMG